MFILETNICEFVFLVTEGVVFGAGCLLVGLTGLGILYKTVSMIGLINLFSLVDENRVRK
jgi:hypothetical protein